MISAFFFGLGNPGSEYAKTRHNVGWLALDFLTKSAASHAHDSAASLASSVSWQDRPKFHAQIAQAIIKPLESQPATEVLMIKPQTYMNDSGLAVQAVLSFYDKKSLIAAKEQSKPNNDSKDKAALDHVFVFHDDLDLEIGRWKLQFGTGPKIHNGLSSIYQHLGTKNFWHVRIGVDGRGGTRTIPGHQYVLGGFSPDEHAKLDGVFQEIWAAVLQKIS